MFVQGFEYSQWGQDISFSRNTSLDAEVDGVMYYGYTGNNTPPAWSSANCFVTVTTLSTTMTLYSSAGGSIISYGGSITSAVNSSFTTFTFDENGSEASISGVSKSVTENSIASYIIGNKQTLNVIYFRSTDLTLSAYNNSFKANCHNMSFGYGCCRNTFGIRNYNNSFGNSCYSNSFGNYYSYNSFRDYCYSNTFGNSCSYNSFGSGCNKNTFGNSCSSNSIGNSCRGISFGDGSIDNSFGNECQNNTLGLNFRHNSFGNNCINNSFGSECYDNTFGNDCNQNTFENNCQNNTIGNSCYNNSFGNNCTGNSFGNSCSSINFQKNFTYYCIVENGNQYIDITSTATTSSSNSLRNIIIAQGVNNTSTVKTISHNTVKDAFKTTYQSADSQVISV